ncbi:hypothetical protein G7046_g4447 [Stylonectria norvegica]|nr:hypothetical protein G7046_g4447 [Stylonectria norvegica]
MHQVFTTALLGLLAHSSAANYVEPQSRQLYQFPNATFLENIAVRTNGHLLLNSFTKGNMYTLNPLDKNPVPSVAVTVPGVDGVTGIAEIAHDVFAVTGGLAGTEQYAFQNGSFKVFLVDFNHRSPVIKTVASVPNAVLLNGMAALPSHPHIILSAESKTGIIYRINTNTGAVDIAFQDEKLTLGSGTVTVPIGINGMKISRGYMYFSNSNQRFFGRVKIHADGSRAGAIEKITDEPANTLAFDDFAIAKDGNTYIAMEPSNVAKIDCHGKLTVLVGGDGSTALYTPTSAALSKNEKWLYIATAGSAGAAPSGQDGVVRGGQIASPRRTITASSRFRWSRDHPTAAMPSPRRMRLLMIAALGTVVFILFYTSGFDSSRDADAHDSQDFYHKTKNAMDGASPPGQAVLDSQTGQKAGHIPADKDADGDVDEDDKAMAIQMQNRLKAAEQEAKDKANEKGGLRPDPPSNIVGVGSSADGQHKDKALKNAPVVEKSEAAPAKVLQSQEELEAETELKSILKKSPVIIFSKSYCPHSKRAKGLLLEKYLITPSPYVVELDLHPLGPLLQDQLKEKTGRRTVPNVIINGESIGGADDVVALDTEDKLVGKIVSLGNKRVEMVERFVTGGKP